jgi:hypothetical protein
MFGIGKYLSDNVTVRDALVELSDEKILHCCQALRNQRDGLILHVCGSQCSGASGVVGEPPGGSQASHIDIALPSQGSQHHVRVIESCWNATRRWEQDPPLASGHDLRRADGLRQSGSVHIKWPRFCRDGGVKVQSKAPQASQYWTLDEIEDI